MALLDNVRTRARHLAARMALWGAGNSAASSALQSAMVKAFGIGLGDRHPRNVQQMLANTSWTFAANRQIAGRASRVIPQLELCQREHAKPVKRSPVHVHPFLDLIANPNVDESGKVFLWRQILLLNTIGQCIIAVEPQTIDLTPIGINFKASRIAGLRLLEPERTRAISSPDRMVAAFFYSGVRGEQRFYPAAPATYEEREAWKAKPEAFAFRVVMPSPDSYDGQSVTQAGAVAINTVDGLNLLHQNMLYNGLNTNLIVYLKQKGFEDIKRFEEAVIKVRTGLGKAGEPAVFPKDLVEVDKNPVSISDMQYPKLAELARQEALAVLGASDALLGLVKDANRSNMEALERILAIGTIDPMLSLIADGYNTWLLPLYMAQSNSAWFELKYPSSLVQDETMQAQRLKLLVDGTIYTPNEAREELGKHPLPDGDDLMGGSRLQPISLLAESQAGEDEQQLAAQMPGDISADEDEDEEPDQGDETPSRKREPAFPMTIDAGSGGSHLLGAKPEEEPKPKRSGALKAGHRLHSPDERERTWRANEDTRRLFDRELRVRVAKVFARWRDTFRARLAKEGPKALFGKMNRRADGNPDPLVDLKGWVDQLRAEYRPWARAVLLDRIERTMDDLGIDSSHLRADDPLVDRWIESRAQFFASQVAATQQQALIDGMTDVLAQGLNVQDISDASGDWFPNANSGRTRNIGTTESTTAAAAGTHLGAKQARSVLDDPDVDPATITGDADALLNGYGKQAGDHIGLQWLSQRDSKVRDTHAEADGQTIPNGEAFTVGGFQMMYPGDSSMGAGPEEICNCRCSVVAVPMDLAEHTDGFDGDPDGGGIGI